MDTASPPGTRAVPADSSALPHDDKSGALIATVVVCLTVATAATGLRIFTRRVVLNAIGYDDYLAVAALVFTIAYGVIGAASSDVLGHHVYDIPEGWETRFAQEGYAALVVYTITLLLIKTTFLCQFYRVFSLIQNMMMLYFAAMFVVIGWSIAQIFLAILTCNPPAATWDPTVKAKCLDINLLSYVSAAGTIITDLIVFLLPIPCLWKLNMVPAQKRAVLAAFMLGLFTCVISFIRLSALQIDTSDPTYSELPGQCWTMAELTSGITCAGLSTMRPLLSRYVPSLRARSSAAAQESNELSTTTGARRQATAPKPASQRTMLPSHGNRSEHGSRSGSWISSQETESGAGRAEGEGPAAVAGRGTRHKRSDGTEEIEMVSPRRPSVDNAPDGLRTILTSLSSSSGSEVSDAPAPPPK
ncbi:hypothetical protein F4780DRAFT_795424 [Xylariomycetidae sp. FL0641]|nr:hypothetical protein F4780DRAFT_795424 [Xylariomycetidae sp. FL0641]